MTGIQQNLQTCSKITENVKGANNLYDEPLAELAEFFLVRATAWEKCKSKMSLFSTELKLAPNFL
jgi:hypothetical protein